MNHIVVNKIKCKKCGDIIESTSVHDFKRCKCGSVAIDGGNYYLKRCGNLDDIIDLSVTSDDIKSEKPSIYITGDTHGDFKRFTKKKRMNLPFELTENDYVIICGDFGLCWANDKEFEYNCNWLGSLPFKILWVQGNHENYSMISDYPIEYWNGGKVRHIVRDKIILLERGQVFNIEGKTFFTFGGASSHDIQGGVLNRSLPTFKQDLIKANKSGLPYRVLNESWWKEELPSEEEMQEGRDNLAKVDYKVDYVISHCGSSNMQNKLELNYTGLNFNLWLYKRDILTDYFDELESKLQYKHWFMGHYHDDIKLDDKHTILYYNIIPLLEVYKNDNR